MQAIRGSAMVKEIERLREEATMLRRQIEKDQALVMRLRAENERLREALEELRYACTDKALAMADAALAAGGE